MNRLPDGESALPASQPPASLSEESALPESALYRGQVYHRRTRPRVHALRYRVFTLLLDLDDIETLAGRLWMFSHNRWNLASFHDSDFGDPSVDETLPRYIVRLLEESGESRQPARILISCYPRIVGYVFNPLTMFYCLDRQGRVFAVVHEVHNTFGERHAYVLEADDTEGHDSQGWIRQGTDKALFVSPFAHMQMRYEFRLNVPRERQVIVIRAFDDQGQWLTASYTASREPLTESRLLRCFLALPLLTVKVIVAIHWEALRLWIKRVPWFTHVPKPTGR